MGKRTSGGDAQGHATFKGGSRTPIARGNRFGKLSGFPCKGIRDTPKIRAAGDGFLAGGMHASAQRVAVLKPLVSKGVFAYFFRSWKKYAAGGKYAHPKKNVLFSISEAADQSPFCVRASIGATPKASPLGGSCRTRVRLMRGAGDGRLPKVRFPSSTASGTSARVGCPSSVSFADTFSRGRRLRGTDLISEKENEYGQHQAFPSADVRR